MQRLIILNGAVLCMLAAGTTSVAIGQETRKIYRVGEEGVTAPKVLYKVEPAYTDEARNAKIEGVVGLSVEIDVEGLAQNIQVERSLDGGLDQSAVSAVAQWRFQPGEKNGRPVRIAAKIEVNFRLN